VPVGGELATVGDGVEVAGSAPARARKRLRRDEGLAEHRTAEHLRALAAGVLATVAA
jgi:hypothetical protein